MFLPVHSVLKTRAALIVMTPELRQMLKDWRTLIQHMNSNLTPAQLLVSEFPNIIEYTDACKLGAAGIITPGMDPFQHGSGSTRGSSKIRVQDLRLNNFRWKKGLMLLKIQELLHIIFSIHQQKSSSSKVQK